MEVAVRVLRDGVISADNHQAAPLVLLEDSLGTTGGPAVFAQVLADLCAAATAQRAQCQLVSLAAFTGTPSAHSAHQGVLQLVDCFSDPYGWHCGAEPSTTLAPVSRALPGSRWRLEGGPSNAQTSRLQGLQNLLLQPASLHTTSSALPEPSGRPLAIVIESLSTLLRMYPHELVVAWMHRLQLLPQVSCIFAALHTDLHPPHITTAFEHLAACVLQLEQVTPLQRSMLAASDPTNAPDGMLTTRRKQRSGRVHVDRELYRVPPGRAVRRITAPLSPVTAAGVASTYVAELALRNNGSGGLGPAAGRELAEASGSMKLTLSEAERQAREAVILPYEHQGSARVYQASDYREYLPPAAGGVGIGAGEGRLGHILYVRDSENECDSDEDPDDDLDI